MKHICIDCGNPVFKTSAKRCRKCYRKYTQIPENNPHYKGRYKNKYIYIKRKNHPFSDIKGYVPESRLVMEKSLNRYINPKKKEVHHKNGIKTDNRLENLEVISNHKHHQIHFSGKNNPNWKGGISKDKNYIKQRSKRYMKKWWAENKDRINRLRRKH